MKLLLSIFSFFLTLSPLQVGTTLYVASSYCYVYTDPDFESAKIEVNEDFYTLKTYDEVEFRDEQDDFYLVKTKDDIEGWVYKYYLTTNKSQSVYPVFNATIRNDCEVYNFDGTKNGQSLKKDARVYLYKGFNDKEKFTSIQYIQEDGTLVNAMVLTEQIQPDGLSSLVIVAISLVASITTIVLMVVFIKKPKKKSKKVA